MNHQQTRHTRRTFLQTSGIGAFGLTLPALLQLEDQARAAVRQVRPKNLIFLFLYGGPSQIDTWDMKPDAPEDYRGTFQPIQSSVPGTHMVEHLPRMAQMAQHYSIIRTLHHVNRNHQPAGCWMLTGVNPRSDNAAQLRTRPDDPPALGSLAVQMAPVRNAGVPPFIMMPARLQDQGSFFRGQTGGILGSHVDPLLLTQDPNDRGFSVEAFEPQSDISAARMQQHRSLLDQFDRTPLSHQRGTQTMNEFHQRAFDLISNSRGQSAFNLNQEQARTRDRYGRNMFGQEMLLARRLVEADARVVTVSYCTKVGHHEWDTHSSNFSRLRNTLLPTLDQAYTALLQDLFDRGLLQDTVVYLGGEFGRTPRIGQGGFSGSGASRDGRDHYPNCFPGILAGGLSRPGIIYGQSDSKAAYPARDPVTPEDLAATLFAAMGLDPEMTIYTRENRPMIVTHGRPVRGLLA